MSQQGNKRSRLGKNVATSAPPVPAERWPRPQGKAFNLPAHLQPAVFKKEKSHTIDGHFYRATSEEWLTYHSVFYNGLLNVTFDPTRVLNKETLDRLGIRKQVALLLRNMNMGTITFESYDLYPDLARQFLATCEVISDGDCDDPAAGRLTFMCHGQRYWLTLDQLAEIFEFETEERATGFKGETLGQMGCFWNSIAFGDLVPNDMKVSRIRNPVLRIVAKALGHTMFCKKEPGSLRQDELMMLFLGLGDQLVEQAEFRAALGPLQKVHMGAYFAEILAGRKYRGLGVTKEERIEPVGSLITPILKFCRVELPEEYKDKTKGRLYIDDQYLSNSRICRRKIYQWTAPGGVTKYCQLPKTAWTHLRAWEQISFELPESERCTSVGTPLVVTEPEPQPRHSARQPPPPTYGGTSAHVGDGQYCVHGTPSLAPEPITEDFPEEYYADMEPLPAGATFDEWRVHSDKVQQKQTGILRRILSALTKVKWIPPPACCSHPEDVQVPVPSPVPAEVSAEESSGESTHGGDTRMSGASSSGSGPPRQRTRLE